MVYKKLRLLVDLGCIFIGHGLSKDFRIISKAAFLAMCMFKRLPSFSIDLFVPPEQVIDTVDLYFIESRQRRLSLRFLSWIVLGENIQTETHDSIEDARCALMLYEAYHEAEEQGIFDQKLEDLYREGKKFVSCFAHEHTAPNLTFIDRTGGHQMHKVPRRHRLQLQVPLLPKFHNHQVPITC